MLTSPAIIDWLQFTVPLKSGTGRRFKEQGAGAAGWISDGILETLQDWGMSADVAAVLTPAYMKTTGASAPYNAGITGDGITYYWHDASPTVDTLLCQVSGVGCARLRYLDMLTPVLRQVQSRVSRIDIAIDVETDAPLESLYTTTKRQSYINSKSGQTFYVGSMKSKNYVRVYRYAPPHPRAAFARFEAVYRRSFAAGAALRILQDGLEQTAINMLRTNRIVVCDALQEALGGGERMRIAPPVNTGTETTRTWLIEAAAPAFRKLVAAGGIADAQAFINEHFMDGLL